MLRVLSRRVVFCPRSFHSSVAPRTVVVRHELKAKENSIPAPPEDWKAQLTSLGEDEKLEMARLRNENPFEWSLTKLAKKYNISRRAVGTVAKLSDDNTEKVASANIYKMNPSSNWKGPVHYRAVRNLQKERENYDKTRQRKKAAALEVEKAKANATLV